jgi:two-component system, NtrC family, sensor histidine kinase HydH
MSDIFRARTTLGRRVIPRAGAFLVLIIVAATGLNVWLVLEIRKGQRAFQEILRGGVTEDIVRLGSLPAAARWQLAFALVVLVVLIVSALALVVLVRAYTASEQSRRETENLAHDILAGMDYGLVTTDREGNVTSANPRAREILGWTADVVGCRLSECGPAGPLLAELSREVLEQGRAVRDRPLNVARGHHAVSLQAECHELRNTQDQRSGVVLHVRDVTEGRLMEERIRRMERFMGLGTLAAGLHHEIKNPLSALSLHVQLLEEGLEGRMDQEVAHYFGVLKTEVTRISGVLESFRDYASVERLNLAATDVPALVRQTLDLIHPKARQQQVRLRLEMAAPPPPPAWIDGVRFEQVLLNLAINALDEMREGGTLSVSIRSERNQVLIDISDTGPGIPETVHGRVFDPYFTTKSDGTGLGLAYCDKIIRLHGGHIDFDSGPRGTVFHISLPVAPPDE